MTGHATQRAEARDVEVAAEHRADVAALHDRTQSVDVVEVEQLHDRGAVGDRRVVDDEDRAVLGRVASSLASQAYWSSEKPPWW